jgi:hypothetical protein
VSGTKWAKTMKMEILIFGPFSNYQKHNFEKGYTNVVCSAFLQVIVHGDISVYSLVLVNFHKTSVELKEDLIFALMVSLFFYITAQKRTKAMTSSA